MFHVIGLFPHENIQECAFTCERLELRSFGAGFGYFDALLFKMGLGELFFTCYDVFDVIGRFPFENFQECEFKCEQLKPGSFGHVLELFGLIRCSFVQNGSGSAPFHLLGLVWCNWMVPTLTHPRMHVNTRTAQTGLNWSRLGKFGALSCKTGRDPLVFTFVICLMSLDGSHVKTSKNACLHANGPNGTHLEPFQSGLGKFGALLCKTGQEALFFTCCDVFDVIGWFPHENI